MKPSNNQRTNQQTLEQINQKLLQGANKKTNLPKPIQNQLSHLIPKSFKTINKLLKQTNVKKKG